MMRGKVCPTADRSVNYSGGYSALNSKTQSRLLNSGLTLTALHIQMQLITSQPLYPKWYSINFPERFPAFRPVEASVGATVAAATFVKVVSTAAASKTHRGRSTQAITRIGNTWAKNIAKQSSPHERKKGSRSSHTTRNKYVVYTNRQLSGLSSTLTEMKTWISDFSGKPQGTNSSKANSGQEAPVSGDAGNSFGGHVSKHTNAWLARPLALVLSGLMMFIKFYLLTRLGGGNLTRARIMKTIQMKQVVSSVWQKMGPTICLSSSRPVINSDNAYYGMIELDSHVDTTIIGSNCVILTYTGKECKVSPYNDEYQSIQHMPGFTQATAWTCPPSGKTLIIVSNEALWMGDKLDHTLMNSN